MNSELTRKADVSDFQKFCPTVGVNQGILLQSLIWTLKCSGSWFLQPIDLKFGLQGLWKVLEGWFGEKFNSVLYNLLKNFKITGAFLNDATKIKVGAGVNLGLHAKFQLDWLKGDSAPKIANFTPTPAPSAFRVSSEFIAVIPRYQAEGTHS